MLKSDRRKSYNSLKNVFVMYFVLLVSAIMSVYLKIPESKDIILKVATQSIYIFLIVVMSIHIEITILYLVLKIIGIKGLQYKKITQLLSGTAYYAYSLLTLLVVLISPILAKQTIEMITMLIEIIKITISYFIIKNTYNMGRTRQIIIIMVFLLFAVLYLIM